MIINTNLLEAFENSESKLLAVTKYWDLEETQEIIQQIWDVGDEILIWIGENRVKVLQEKELERGWVHFIWNIQTKEIKHITKYCWTIHSLSNNKHIRKIDEICSKQWNWVKVFLQINLDPSKDSGIQVGEIPKYMEAIDETENISLIWFSAIWKWECSEDKRREEFILLKELRAKYLPNGLISAGTSRDYEIALEEEIDIIRVGKALVLED